jgi:hypothetical protein
LAVTFSWLPASAPADGDPASDVLASQSAFLPQDAGLTANQQTQLGALLAAAQRRGYPIRVAVIASSADLGSVTALWREPQNYARFLGQELSPLYRGPLLIVMPNGYGFYQAHGAHAAERAALGRLAAAKGQLGAGTLTAIQRVANASGHGLPIPTTATPSGTPTNDTVPWLVFALGAALIAAAWSASLRARPLRTDRTTPAARS